MSLKQPQVLFFLIHRDETLAICYLHDLTKVFRKICLLINATGLVNIIRDLLD